MECKNCKTELTKMETNCLRCLKCNPVTANVPPEAKEKNYVDVPWTEERIAAICERVCKRVFAGMLEDWHIHKPDEDIDDDLTATEAAKRTGIRQPDNPPEKDGPVEDVKSLQWRMRAKELGISLYHRTKEDVLAEIAERKVPVGV